MKPALLTVSFGTSVPEARESIDRVERALRRAAPDRFFCRAFTSPTIRRILADRGETIRSLSEMLVWLRQQHVEAVAIQPTHILYGYEYDRMRETTRQFAADFAAISLGKPLLSDSEDWNRVAEILCRRHPMQEDEALVLMGHGTGHAANEVYPALQAIFRNRNRPDVLVGTVEGRPSFADCKTQLKRRGYAGARLLPLMLTAGEHARKDMAGEEPFSWKSQLEAEGISVRCTMRGLGLLPEIQEMYVDHLNNLLAQWKG